MSATPLYSYRVFAGAKDAREYRHQQGTGGWIFVPDGGGECILFPPHLTPADIIRHPLTARKTGALVGSM